MANLNTGISFAHYTHNAWNGCIKVKGREGCRFCYAERYVENLGDEIRPTMDEAKRHVFSKIYHSPRPLVEQIKGMTLPVREVDGKWYPPRVFVNSMSDFFLKAVKDHHRDACLDLYEQYPEVCWIILTKRHEEMVRYLEERYQDRKIPSHIWVGVSIESGEHVGSADSLRRLVKSIGLQVPFISFEPLMGDVSECDLKGIKWAIIGGESYGGDNIEGKEGRRMSPTDARAIIAKLNTHKIPVHFKQWGTWDANPQYRNAVPDQHHAKLQWLFHHEQEDAVIRSKGTNSMRPIPAEPHGGCKIHMTYRGENGYHTIREFPKAFYRLAEMVNQRVLDEMAARGEQPEPILPTVEEIMYWLLEAGHFSLLDASDIARQKAGLTIKEMKYTRPGEGKPAHMKNVLQAIRNLLETNAVEYDGDRQEWVKTTTPTTDTPEGEAA